MKRVSIFLVVILSSKYLLSKENIRIDYFSINYQAKIQVETCTKDSCFGKATISVFDKKKNTLIIELISNNLIIDNYNLSTKEKPVNPNLPSAILFDDYNFDGIEDIGVRNGSTVDGRPRYDIYLFYNNTFNLNIDLTEISNKYSYLILFRKEKIIRVQFGEENKFREMFYYTCDFKNKYTLLKSRKEVTNEKKGKVVMYNTTYLNGKKLKTRKEFPKEKYLWEE